MHKEIEQMKESASSMLKRFTALLGKREAEYTMTNKELTRKLDELMSELEAQKVQVRHLVHAWSKV